jgi:anion-transporting  ArsA/GET3 family ATPase
VEVTLPDGGDGSGRLAASLLDGRLTFDRLVERYAPDPGARDRILGNRFYDHLSGGLAGVLEYMAVERLYEVARSGGDRRLILDTPPTRQALELLEAPQRIVSFLDSGVLKVALRPWFDEKGNFRPTSSWGPLGRGVERYLDEIVGLDLLRDMAEFFQAFGPLYAGFRQRAAAVEELLRSEETVFVLVTGPGEENIPDTLFFARRLQEAGYRLGALVVNRVHPPTAEPERFDEATAVGRRLLAWLGERDARGLEELAALLPGQPLVRLPLLPDAPTDLPALAALARRIAAQMDGQEVLEPALPRRGKRHLAESLGEIGTSS